MKAQVEVFKSSGIQPWRFRLRSSNGEIVSQSEGYVTRWSAKRSARKIAEQMGVPLVDVEPPYRKFGG